jgi:pyrroline-5-carboxylate reductase
MTKSEQVAFLGGGAMGEAIIKALVTAQVLQPTQIRVSEPDAARRNGLRERYGIQTLEHNSDAVRDAGTVVLAVKPQVVGQVFASVKDVLAADALVFSIAAGITIDTIRAGLNASQPVVRTIPNTPAQIGQGITAWTATANVSEAQLTAARMIMGAMGQDVQVEKELYIDMATAVNGSGPAFLFVVFEAMIDAAVQIGLARPVAEKLVLQTVKGSIEYAQQSPQHLAQLKNQVTSPGGTTAAGLYAMEKAGIRTAMADAIRAAYARSVELGK